jgi:hypothetical protein
MQGIEFFYCLVLSCPSVRLSAPTFQVSEVFFVKTVFMRFHRFRRLSTLTGVQDCLSVRPSVYKRIPQLRMYARFVYETFVLGYKAIRKLLYTSFYFFCYGNENTILLLDLINFKTIKQQRSLARLKPVGT